jgi:hypothetical protein
MERAKQKISKAKPKNFTLIGKCGKCKKEFTAEAVLPLINYWDEGGNSYEGMASPHLITNCPYCFGLLNLALRTETNKRRA